MTLEHLLSPAAPAVSLDRRGLWRRLALERGDGTGDIETFVVWLQTGSLYADLRIPAGRPDFAGVTHLDEVSAEAATWLARQEGFAGPLHLDDDDAHWIRDIDFAPLAGPPDEGFAMPVAMGDEAMSVASAAQPPQSGRGGGGGAGGHASARNEARRTHAKRKVDSREKARRGP